MELNEIKKALYREKPIAVRTGVTADKSLVTYQAKTSLGQHTFLIPSIYADNFKKEEAAQLLIKWLIWEKLIELHDFTRT